MLTDEQNKMELLISSTTNDWPQIDNDDTNDHTNMMMTSSTTTAAAIGASNRLMEKPGQEQLQQQQQALKCPRCDSSNTKFCYYNNYSLSQPRHFCKACKRYWTRGGTLRNVPVGGGCRKNKRLKRPSSTTTSAVDNNGASSSASSAPTTNNNSSNPNPQIDLASNSHINPMFYQPDHQHMGININPFTTSGFDQFASLGLGFGDHHHQRFNPTVTSKQIQDLAAANSIFNSTTTYSAAPTMASVLASKFSRANNNNTNQYFQNLLPFEDLQIAGNGEAAKEVKLEEAGQGRMAWISRNINHEANIELSSDPSLYYNLGAYNWHDPGNLGSSVSSLI